MTCRRSATIDVESFLLDSSSADFESFRMHFVDCADCSDVVLHWTTFELALRDVLGSDGGSTDGESVHPEPARLEAFLASQGSGGDQAIWMENHLANCSSCRTELNVLKAYEPDSFEARHGTVRSSEGWAANWLPERLRGFETAFSFDGGLRGAAMPSLAMAMLVVIGLWWNGALPQSGSLDLRSQVPQLVRSEARPLSNPVPPNPILSVAVNVDPAFGADVGADPAQVEHQGDRIALRLQPASLPEADQSLSPSEELAPVQLAEAVPLQANGVDHEPEPQAQTLAQTQKVVETEVAEEVESAPPQEILLAALSQMPLPNYDAPVGAKSLEWMRQFGAVRSRTVATSVEARAPADHVGLSLSSSPRLWWRISRAVELSVEVTIVDDRNIEPVLRVSMTGPHDVGLHSFDLAAYGATLEAGVDYRWFVSLIVDSDRPSRNPVATGAIQVIAESDWRREAATQIIPSERGHTMAQLGIWYDAYDFFASLSQAHPEATSLARYRDRLVELVVTQR